MIKLLILLNLMNMLDALITSWGVYLFGNGIEGNPLFADNVLLGMWLIKIPSVLLVSWVLFHFDKRTTKEQKFLKKVILVLTILMGLVVLWNCWMILMMVIWR